MGTGIFCCGLITTPPGNVVGGIAEGAGNVIAFNGAKGILVLGNRLSFTGPRVSILGNSIYANELLGIDLSTDGPTPNDPTDSDDGPNDFQNFPVIGTITSGGGQTVATTAFSSTPDTEFRLEFFRSTSCNNKPPPSFSWFFGQGQTLVGTRKVMTDSAGNWSDQVTLAGETTPTEVITATATRFTEPGQTLAGSTSEFSECLADLAITKKDEPDPVAAGGSLTYTIDLTNDGPAPATSVRVTDTLPSSVTVTSITPSQGSCSRSGSTVTCELGSIVRDGNARVTIVLNPGTAVRQITNTARVTSEPRDPDASDNSATATTQVVTGGSLVVRKVTVPSPDASDTSFAFTAGGGLSPASFSLKNGEPRTFANIAAKAGYSVAETTPAGWDTASTCSDGSPVSNIDVGPGETVTCTFTNTKRGTLVVRKVTVPSPDASDTSFAFAAGGGLTPASFNLKNGESHTFADVAPKAGYSVAETTPAGWDTAGTCSDGSPISNIDVGPGETVTCTFTNTKRGVAKVVKTVRGTAPTGSQSFCFDLRTGASTTSAGTVLESQCATAGNGGLINFSTTLVPSAAYALCEIVLPGWMTTLGPPFYVVYNPSGDNSTVCTDFRVDPGQTRTFAVDNIPPPGGLARTIGFWKNWASCAASKGKQKPVLDQTLAAADPVGIAMGTLTLHAGDCLKAVRLLDKSTVDTDKKMASDPAFGLAAQLLAARLNIVAGAGSCAAAVSAINDAQTLLASIHFNGITHDKLSAAQATQANSLATTLDRYNNDLLC
jgi:uncharacterized repeat protein (TIGR01451 family)